MREYQYIELQFEQADDGIGVRINESPVGQKQGDFRAPFTPGRATVRLDEAEVSGRWKEEQVALGTELYQALEQDQVGEALRAAVNQARGERKRVILQLRFDEGAVALAGLPWELLHDDRRHLLAAGAVDLTRYVSYDESVVPLMVEPPLRVLQVGASPSDCRPLDIDASKQTLKEVTGLAVEALPEPTFDALLGRMEVASPVHVLHFDGHGIIEEGRPVLCFEDQDGAMDPVSVDALQNALYNRVSLVVLNACRSSEVTEGMATVFESMAPALIEAGIPAVVGMQFPIQDRSAIRFMGAFYGAIARGEPLTQAMTTARRWLYREETWHVPTLYLRSDDPTGRLFPPGQEPIQMEAAPEIEEEPDQPVDPVAVRRAHLEEHIEKTLDLIKENEDTIRVSDDIDLVARCKKELVRLRQLLQAYQQEFAELVPQEEEAPEVVSPEFSEARISQLPYAIAAKCAAFNRAEDGTARFLALDGLLLGTIKYLAAIALAQYRQDHPRSPELLPWLKRLSRRHLSEWVALLEEVDAHYRQDMGTRPPLMALLFDPYRRPLADDTPMVRAHRELGAHLTGGGKEQRPTMGHFVQRLVTYRERTWEAGVLHLPPQFGETLVPLLQPALQQMLGTLTFLGDYGLRYTEHAERVEDVWMYQMTGWRGPSETPTHDISWQVTSDEAEPPYKPRRLYLCAPNGQPLLNLHPLHIHHEDRLYFLESFGEDEAFAFRPCHAGEVLDVSKALRSSLMSICKPLADEADTGEVLDEIEKKVEEMDQPDLPEPTPEPELPLAELLERLSEEGREGLAMALGEALRIGHFWLGVEFLLMGLTKQEGRPLGALLHELKESRGRFRGALRGMVGVATKDDWRRQRDVAALGAEALPELREADPETLAAAYGTDEMPRAVVTPRMMQVLRDAAKMAGEEQIGHSHLLLAALRHVMYPAVNVVYGLAVQQGWNPGDVPAWVAQQGAVEAAEWEPLDADEQGVRPPSRAGRKQLRKRGGDAAQPPLKVRGVLASFGRDLTRLAQEDELRPAIGKGAHGAMVQMGLILQQTQANNPILLGDPGVGKTAIVEGFAWRLAVGAAHGQPVMAELASKRIVDLPAASLVAGTKYRGELEERLQKLVAEVRAGAGEIIVFIDEIHTILGGRAEGGLGVIADALKPALARGEFPCIGATTVGEYRRYIEADPALARRFTPVWIEEPTEEEAIEIVQAVAEEHLGPSHKVTYGEEVVKEAVRLSLRYLHDERLPGKAIKLLDQAGPRVVMGGSLRGLGEVDKDRSLAGRVTVEMVREIVSERTGVPLARLSEGESKKLIGLEAKLTQRVKGQDEAVIQVARVVKRARAGLADPRRPLGVFLFAGPTGVGKTELSLALAEALFDEEDAILRLDMSEYMEKHQISRLIGAPPGYKGYEEEGQLTGRLRRRPYSVVLLDEIEKAHKEVQHLFLQLFDAGRLTDARGNLADGRNAIFVMTTNLGAKVPMGFNKAQMPSFAQQMRLAIEEHFTPEFLNRIDRVVYFEPLDKDVLLKIFDREFEAVAERLGEQGIEVQVTEPFKEYLCEKYTDPTRGARRLQRAIEDEIVTPLTDRLLAGEIEPGMEIVVSAKDAFARLAARLRERGIEVEIEDRAREFICDPKQVKIALEDALVKLIEAPLMARLAAEELEPGDRVWVKRYADHLEFEKQDTD